MFKKGRNGLALAGLLAVMAACGGPVKDYDYQPLKPADYFLPCQYANVEGIKIAYVETGPVSAPCLIFIHGLLGRLDNWRWNAPAFADRYHVLALDLPGFGNSEMADRDITIELFARVVKGLMDQKGIARAAVIGNSMGGETALFFAIHYPDRVDKLVLVDAAGLIRPQFFGRLIADHTNKVGDLIVHRVQRRTKNKPASEIYPVLKDKVLNPERRRRVSIAFDLKNPNVLEMNDGYALYYASLVKTREFEWHVKGALRSFRSIARTDLIGQVGAVRAPTLIIWGDQDQLIPPKFAEIFRKAIAGSRLVWIKDAGHIPMIEKPAEFNQALNEFLSGP